VKVCTQCKLAALCLAGSNMHFMPSYEPWYGSEGRRERVALRVAVIVEVPLGPGVTLGTSTEHVYSLSNDCPDKRGRMLVVYEKD
jgi:hypothetical protein